MRTLALGLALLVGGAAGTAAPDPTEIARRSDQALKGRTQQATVSMTVRTPDWERTLELESWYANPDRMFIRVTGPAKEAGTTRDSRRAVRFSRATRSPRWRLAAS